MTYTLVVDMKAAAFLRTARSSDPDGVRTVRAAIAALAQEPRPEHASRLTNDLYRLHVGDYRVLYEVHDAEITVLVIHVGRRSPS